MSEPRLPRNLQGLLRFCMQTGDDPQPSAGAAAMDPERARWLREAMDSMTVNIGKQLKDNIARLLQNVDAAADGDSAAADVCRDCLEETADLCDSLDVANDFVKLGGLDVAAYVCRRCASGGLRVSSLHLMARLFQNNPFAQAAGVGCVAELVEGVRAGSGSDGGGGAASFRFAALSALSCLVRDCQPAQAAFAEAAGPAAVARCLCAGGDADAEAERRLRRKAAFLLASLAAESDALAERLADDSDGVGDALTGAIVDAAAACKDGDDADAEPARFDWLEHAVDCLLHLLSQRPRSGSAVSGRRGRELADALQCLAGRLPADRYPECAERMGQLLALLPLAPLSDGGGAVADEPADR